MTDILTLRKFEALSPFEIKDELISLAKKASRTTQSAFLNAGRGNPNWVATTPREGFFLLGQFALTESRRVMDHPAGIGGMQQSVGLQRFEDVAYRRSAPFDGVKIELAGRARVAAHSPHQIFLHDPFVVNQHAVGHRIVVADD